VNKAGKHSIFKASLLASLLAAGLHAHAAGLGKLMVYSAIGQPLSAEVAITATPEELGSLTAKLASHDAFRDAGVELMPALTGLRFNVVKQTGGQSVLKLSTDRPLNEPFLHFLVELSWTSGRMVREYTFLLDPPEMLQVAKPASVVTPAVPVAQPPVKVRPLPGRVSVTDPSPAPMSPATNAAGEYRVKAGDTLGRIARETRLDSVSLDQMLLALFNSNRDAFDGNNMNRLRAGKILRIPDAAAVTSVEQKEARKLVIGQAAEFNAYKRRLAEAAGAAPAAPTTPPQQASGKIAPKVEDKAPPLPASDKLEVSRTEAGKSSVSDGARKALEEDLIARDKALHEANSRIADLEKNLENLKKLIELKSQAGTQVQQQAQAVVVAPKPEEKKPDISPVTADKPGTTSAEPLSLKPVADAAAPVNAVPAPPTTVEEKPVSVSPPPPAVKKSASPPPPPPPPPDFVEDNPELVFGGAGLLALLLGYLGFSAWRRKKQASQNFEDQPSVSESEIASKSGAVFGAASESVDNGEVSIQGDFSETGVLTTEESVDPVAEADVLMAYGRDGQAEEILLEGLKSDPVREAIHVKLLELYANRGSTTQFEAIANQLHQINGGLGGEWDKATALARHLGVTGGVFAENVAADDIVAVDIPHQMASSPASSDDHLATVIMAAVPQAVEPEPNVPTEASDSLEFDLDLGTTSGPAMQAAAEKAAVPPPPAADEAVSLDFDFDLGAPEPAEQPVEAVLPAVSDVSNEIDFSIEDMGTSPAAGEPEPLDVKDANDIDFDLDLGTPAAPDLETAVPEAPDNVSASVESAREVEFDLDLGGESVGAAEPDVELPPVVETDAPIAEASPAGLDLSAISLDLDEPAPVVSDSEALLELPAIDVPAVEFAEDIGEGLDLSLDIGDALPEDSKPDVAAPGLVVDIPDLAAGESDVGGAPVDVDNPEVATKLELAQAYEEMGDIEGAKELLTEVLGEGSPAQKAAAQARFDQMKV
jgi:pilus assembly protein FimV